MRKLPIDLPLRTINTRVSVAAWDRAHELADVLDCRLQDVISAALLYIDENKLKRIMADQKAAVDALPKTVRAVLKNPDTLKIIRDLLDE